MITIDEIQLLQSEEIRKVVAENIGNDPMKIALNKRLDNAKLIATQVKYLQRAKSKLPSYYNAQCVIPSLAFEQCSSEECAAHKSISGELCVDLTCGLGVDSYYLSQRFERVISVEQNPTLAHLAQLNFSRLGVTNIEVVCAAAEDFVRENPDLKADVIYCDPDRRGANGEKLYGLEQCTPNIVELLPVLRRMAQRIMVKCSPLMDIDEAFRVFGSESSVEVVSLGGECKEVVVTSGAGVKPTITATAIGIGSVSLDAEREHIASVGKTSDWNGYQYLIIPDVALQKARLAKDVLSAKGVLICSDNGYGFSLHAPDGIIGKVFEIERVERYSPKLLKKELKESKIKRIMVLKRDFPYPTSKITKELSVSEGGTKKIAFTEVGDEFLAVFLR